MWIDDIQFINNIEHNEFDNVFFNNVINHKFDDILIDNFFKHDIINNVIDDIKFNNIFNKLIINHNHCGMFRSLHVHISRRRRLLSHWIPLAVQL